MFGRKIQLKEYNTSAEALSTLNYAKVTTSKGVLMMRLFLSKWLQLKNKSRRVHFNAP